MLNQIVTWLAWLLIPVAAITLVDDWFLRPRRRLAALPGVVEDPPFLRAAYAVLPVLAIAGAIKLLRSERLDFSLVLVLVTVIGAVIWAIDVLLLAPARARCAGANASVPEPGIVDYARSMVPVVLVVLLLRSFLFEPFRIPSDSMMPTLQDGDFILVNKFRYGLRLPVTNTKILSLGEPRRGDVVVFRYPPDPAVNYIKRLAGLPGDRVRIVSDHIYVNDVPLEERDLGRYSDGCYENMRLSEEHTGEHVHHVLSCRSQYGIVGPPLPGCNRRLDRGYSCVEDAAATPGASSTAVGAAHDSGDFEEITVPAGKYLMIGDNRDNSSDGRVWGLVPEANLVGSARRIWLNLDLQRSKWIDWSRIGKQID
ncbi:MAG: signal peptidase I [Pseudomonadota bacterium]